MNVTTPTAVDVEKKFDWPLCYEAESMVQEHLDLFLSHHEFAAHLAERMRLETGTLFFDWVDYLVVSQDEAGRWKEVGFQSDPIAQHPEGWDVMHHPAAMLPRVLLKPQARNGFEVGLKVDSVAQFLLAHRLHGDVVGSPYSRFRTVMAAESNGAHLHVVERRGYRGYTPNEKQFDPHAVLQAYELWKLKPRVFQDDAQGFKTLQSILDQMIKRVGRDMTCHLVFQVEREFWQHRNRAAQVQKMRQDRLGLGWANQDHHTFRSSRAHFVDLMMILDKLGFQRRERYYAGAAAGWGAQISEQHVEGIVTFCDVDLMPEETEIDFSRQPLPPSSKLGTIGLWVGLHGESMLDAGMHHLEARFDYPLLREQLASMAVNTMAPFSDFPFLKQAFTEGERWNVRPERARRLLDSKLITHEQYEKFVREGAIGSHLENLQRKGGFKGFNQKSVSVIIQATDPRTASHV